MKREFIMEYIPFIEAINRGITVEQYEGGKWIEYATQGNIYFTHEPDHYRIKPAMEYEPFDESNDLVGLVVKNKNAGVKFLISAQSKDCVLIFDDWVTYQQLLDNFTHYNGSALGKKTQGA